MRLPLRVVKEDFPTYGKTGRGIRIVDADHKVVCSVLPGQNEDGINFALAIVRKFNGWRFWRKKFYTRDDWEWERNTGLAEYNREMASRG